MASPTRFRFRLLSVAAITLLALGLADLMAQAPQPPTNITIVGRPAPVVISLLSPSSGAEGAPVTITGSGFGAVQGASIVTFNGVTATINTWSSLNITTTVPVGASTGPVLVLVVGGSSNASTFTVTSTGCVVTTAWVDPLGYQKPCDIAVTEPDEVSAANKYFVDLASGSGTTCSTGSPCGLSGLQNKAGMSGGPAYVYLRGSGALNLFNPAGQMHGSAGNEIVFKHWAGQSAAVFTIDGSSNVTGTTIHHWIMDGGTAMEIEFLGNSSNNNAAVRVNADDITMYRVRGHCTPTSTNGEIFMPTAAGVDRFHVINSEFYDCNAGNGGLQQSAIYMDGDTCNGVASHTDFQLRGSIVRNMSGEGVEINPRGNSDGTLIEDTVFHNIGFTTCGGSWNCRPAITIDSCGATTSTNVMVRNNVMWNLSASCAWLKFGSPEFYNNTCWDYGKGTGNQTRPEGISTVANTPIVKNNIIVAIASGIDPFDAAFSGATNNICATGKTCGAATQVYSAGTFQSTTESAATFLIPGAASNAVDHGVTLSQVLLSFLGLTRPVGAAYDIGAYER